MSNINVADFLLFMVREVVYKMRKAGIYKVGVFELPRPENDTLYLSGEGFYTSMATPEKVELFLINHDSCVMKLDEKIAEKEKAETERKQKIYNLLVEYKRIL